MASLVVVGLVVVGLLAFYTLYLNLPLSIGVLVIAVLGLALAFVDTAFGMGFGTLGTPILLIVGLSSKLAVPSILIAQAVSALAGFLLHHRYKNVESTENRLERQEDSRCAGGVRCRWNSNRRGRGAQRAEDIPEQLHRPPHNSDGSHNGVQDEDGLLVVEDHG